MAQIICPECEHKFDSKNPESFVTRGAAAAAFAVTGAWLGSSYGIVGGPGTAIAGTVPGGHCWRSCGLVHGRSVWTLS
jgi:hypothetical protein